MKIPGSYILLVLLSFTVSCNTPKEKQTNKNNVPKTDTIDNGRTLISEVSVDLEDIKKKGTLTALTRYSSTSFFIYKGELMGYEYELLKWLAEYLGVSLEVEVVENVDSLVSMLNLGRGDLIANNITITKERKDYLSFTKYHTLTEQVLVQRKPENWEQMAMHNIEEKLIRNPIDLIGKSIHVRKNSAYYARLQNLSEEIGGEINIIPAEGHLVTEELIHKVANGEIDYTIADKNIALLNQTYYSNIDVGTKVSFPQRIAWAVRKNSPDLHDAVDSWIEETRGSLKYNVIYKKYFTDTKNYKQRVKSDFFSKGGNKISPYDDILKKYADSIKWDWRLLASLAYQESNFDPQTTSWAGAMGLMQVLPSTAYSFGITALYNPEENVRAGTAYLKYLDEYWKEIPDTLMRRKFVLASYNAGPGHVDDARKLTEKYEKDPNIWDENVAVYLRLKSKPEYYNDKVVKYGYCRGEEPYNYVREIADRYAYYSEFIPK